MSKKNILIVGGGHNGLVCAFYLAQRGHRVRVLERRHVVGGAAVTEEFAPGFRNSTASYTVSLLHPKVIADMRLSVHGLHILSRPYSNFLPSADGRYLRIGGDLARSQAEVAKFSVRDAERLPAFFQMVDGVADVLRQLIVMTPPNAAFACDAANGSGLDVLGFIQHARVFRHLTLAQRRDVLDLFTLSAAELLERWFESDVLKAEFAFDAVVGNYARPDTPNTAYVFLHHAFGETNGKKGTWGHAVGGMGAITQAMASACREVGVQIELDAPVARVLVETDGAQAARAARVVGVRLEDGREFSADVVASNIHPKLLFEQLLEPQHLHADLRERMRHYRSASGTLRMNLALSELPDFACLPNRREGTQMVPDEHHQSSIIIAPSMDYMTRAYEDAVRDGWSREPIVDMLIPSSVDDSLAPAGCHVASLFCQHVAPELPAHVHGGGKAAWDAAREQVADEVIRSLARWVPNLERAIVARQVLSPLDLERTFGLVGGDIMHGRLSLNQLWSARPVLGHANYRAPIRGLYLCGSGTHPGGGVTGLPGHNAAREILRDLSPWRWLWT